MDEKSHLITCLISLINSKELESCFEIFEKKNKAKLFLSLLSSSNKSKGNNILSASAVHEWRNHIRYWVNIWEWWQSSHFTASLLERALPRCHHCVIWGGSLPSQASISSFFFSNRIVMRMNIMRGFLRTFQWSPQHWNYFHNNAKTSFALFSFSLESSAEFFRA